MNKSSDHVAKIINKEPTLYNATAEERKEMPLCSGVLDYFHDALVAVAQVSYEGNKKHNPGQPTHWARGKSTDHADCILRHLAGRGSFDGKTRHSAALAWRALALLQEEIENDLGLPPSRGSRLPDGNE